MPDNTITEHNYYTGEEITRELTPQEIEALPQLLEEPSDDATC